jgi:hypothetical protein
VYEEANKETVIRRGVVGYLYTSKIYISNELKDNEIIAISQPNEKNENFMVKKIVIE